MTFIFIESKQSIRFNSNQSISWKSMDKSATLDMPIVWKEDLFLDYILFTSLVMLFTFFLIVTMLCEK